MTFNNKNDKSQRPLSVLIPDGGNDTTIKILRCLGCAPLVKTHILARDQFPADRFSRHCKHFHYHETSTDDEWMDTIKLIVEKWGIDVVLPITVEGIGFAARNQKKISSFVALAPVPDYEVLNMSRDKWRLHEFLLKAGLPSIQSVFLGPASQSVADLRPVDSIEYPALLKPTRGRGGSGIVLVNSPADFEAAWKDKRIKRDQNYILQTFIPGIEYSLSILAEKGEIKAYTLYSVLVADSASFRIGKLVEYIDNESILKLGKQLTALLPWNGVADIDILVGNKDNTPQILEINPRFWQSVLGGLIAGVNFPYLSCLSAIGEDCRGIQQAHSRFCRPSLYAETLRSTLTGKGNRDKIRWGESSMKFSCVDPLPEVAILLQTLIKKIYVNRDQGRNYARSNNQEVE